MLLEPVFDLRLCRVSGGEVATSHLLRRDGRIEKNKRDERDADENRHSIEDTPNNIAQHQATSPLWSRRARRLLRFRTTLAAGSEPRNRNATAPMAGQ